jgi:chromosome segregation ATPase
MDSFSSQDSKCASKHELKKLRQQNRCYEQVVDCFKQEMTVMSEQLIHLQEILNLSNQSCREENGQLYNAVVELQKLSEKLQAELIDTEKKVLIANQKNQLKDAKIDELQLIIGQKNADLNIHDEAINEMRMRLEHSVMENHELQATVVSLNSTVMQLQCVVQNCEVESARKNVAKSKGIVCKRSASDCRDDYERGTRKIERLQEECKEQCEKMRTVQNELDRVKEKNKEKTKQLKRQNEELKEKLATSELTKQNLVEQMTQLQNQTTHLAQNECYREHELAQSKQVILELRQTLIELNESLAESELQHMEIAEEFHKNVIQDNREQEDIYLSCRCELALYKKLADRFKASLIETRRNLNELEARNRSLIDELKSKELRISDIQRKAAKKEKETRQYIEELSENLKESKEEEKRLSDFIEHLKTEVQKKLESKKETNQVLVTCCDCSPDMAATQEEISTLKVEIKNMIQNQLALNNENDKLLKQVTCLQSTVNMLDEKNRLLKQKLDKLHTDNQNLKEKSKTLTREKEMFCQTIKNLEMELADAKNNRDDICAESRNVVNNVKAWLDEQRKINDKVKRKTQCYCDTIIKLKQENENLLTQTRPLINSTFKRKCPRNYTPCSPPPLECENSWCLGSQGSGSFQDSPRDSPISCTCSIEEWYSPTYKVPT